MDHPVPAKARPKAGPAAKAQSTEGKACLAGGTAVRPKIPARQAEIVTKAQSAEPTKTDKSAPVSQPAPDTEDLTDRADTAHSRTRPQAGSTQTAPVGSDDSPSQNPLFGRGFLCLPAWASCFILGILRTVFFLFFCLPQPGPSQQSEHSAVTLIVGGLPVRDPAVSSRLSRSALERARPGDRIVLKEDTIYEQVRLENRKWQPEVVLELAPGKAGIWHAPEGADPKKPLLFLNDVEGLRVQGLTLDGDERVEELVHITGHCPGLISGTPANQRFTQWGVMLANCEGR